MRDFLRHIISCAYTLGCIVAANAIQPTIISGNTAKGASEWADSVYASLNPRQRIGQLFMPVVAPGDTVYGLSNMIHYVKNNQVGGLLVSKGTAKEYATLVNEAQKLSKVPLLIAIDGEWGVSMRVSDAIVFPRNLSLGAINDELLLYEYGKEVGRECRELGIHIDFAPVMDVNSNPDNPVIGNRSYGEQTTNVTRKGISFAKGLEDMNVLSVAKHFPGHGSTSEDSHSTLPLVDKSRTELKIIDLLPFREYINARLGGMLNGHLNIPAFGTSDIPSSLNPVIVTDLLKHELGFEGLVFTDALTMKGATTDKSVCVEALKAGNDILLSPARISTEITNIINAVNSGELDSAKIATQIKKILTYKYALGANRHKPIHLDGIESRINTSEALSLKNKLIQASITIIKDPHNLIGKKSARTIYITDNSQSQKEYLRLEIEKGGNLIVVACLGPYEFSNFAQMIAQNDNISVILAYNNTAAARNAAQKVISGELKASGILPVSIPGFARAGTEIKNQ